MPSQSDYTAAVVHQARAVFAESQQELKRSRFLHPAAGVAIFAFDWLLFGSDLVTEFLFVIIASFVGFWLGLIVTFLIQSRVAGDSVGKSLLKGFFAGVVVGVPLPIGGTLVGGFVLAASGIDWLRRPRVADIAHVTRFVREVHDEAQQREANQASLPR